MPREFELVKKAVPSVSRVAILLNPDNPVMAPVLEAMVLTADRPIPASTFLVVSQLAWPNMAIEVDVTAMLAK